MNVCFLKFQIIWLILLFDMCLWLGKRLLLFCQITLGHEIGAGAACLKCKDKCEGFDLHFWRFVLASFLHIYAMLLFMHVVFIAKMYLIMLGHHWFDFYFFLHHHFFKLTNMQYLIYLAKSCHTERARGIICTLLVFLKWEPQVPRCLCQSSITAAVVRAIPNHSHGVSGILWMKRHQCGYRSLDAEPETSSLCLFLCSREGQLAIQCWTELVRSWWGFYGSLFPPRKIKIYFSHNSENCEL